MGERSVLSPLSLFLPSLITVWPVKRYITAFSLSPLSPSPPAAQLGQWGTSCQPPHHHHHLQFLLELVSMLPLLDVTLVVVCKWSNVSLSLSHTQDNENIFSYCVQVSRCCSILHTERCWRRTTTVVGPHWMVGLVEQSHQQFGEFEFGFSSSFSLVSHSLVRLSACLVVSLSALSPLLVCSLCALCKSFDNWKRAPHSCLVSKLVSKWCPSAASTFK